MSKGTYQTTGPITAYNVENVNSDSSVNIELHETSLRKTDRFSRQIEVVLRLCRRK